MTLGAYPGARQPSYFYCLCYPSFTLHLAYYKGATLILFLNHNVGSHIFFWGIHWMMMDLKINLKLGKLGKQNNECVRDRMRA